MNDWKELISKHASLADQDLHSLVSVIKAKAQASQVIGAGDTEVALMQARLILENIQAIRLFDESSRALTRRIYWLTLALVALTVVIAIFTVLLWWRA
jgi:CHASE3 domain sensor protein